MTKESVEQMWWKMEKISVKVCFALVETRRAVARFPFVHRYELWFSKDVWVLYSHTTPNDCTNSIVG